MCPRYYRSADALMRMQNAILFAKTSLNWLTNRIKLPQSRNANPKTQVVLRLVCCYLHLSVVFLSFLAELHARFSRSPIAKKIWLPVHPRKFVSHVTVRPYTLWGVVLSRPCQGDAESKQCSLRSSWGKVIKVVEVYLEAGSGVCHLFIYLFI